MKQRTLYIFLPHWYFASQFYFKWITCSVLCAIICWKTMHLTTWCRFWYLALDYKSTFTFSLSFRNSLALKENLLSKNLTKLICLICLNRVNGEKKAISSPPFSLVVKVWASSAPLVVKDSEIAHEYDWTVLLLLSPLFQQHNPLSP